MSNNTTLSLDDVLVDMTMNTTYSATAAAPYYQNTNPYSTWITTGTGTDTITIADYANGWTGNHALEVKGDANFEGDVKIKGKSIVESLEKIEEKLAILHPNEELEEKWEQLRSLRKMYMELEAEIKEKEQIWGILKK